MDVVIDANILIDLLDIDLFELFLALPWRRYVSYEVVGEMRPDNRPAVENAIEAGRLIRPTFDFDDILQIQTLASAYRRFSSADCSCLYLARKLSANLLTGERLLRNIAREHYAIRVHGTIFVIDTMAGSVVSYSEAHTRLSQLEKINPRLPKSEINRYLERWKKLS